MSHFIRLCLLQLAFRWDYFILLYSLSFDPWSAADASRTLWPAMRWLEATLTSNVLPLSMQGFTTVASSWNVERAKPRGKIWVPRPPRGHGRSWAHYGQMGLMFESHWAIQQVTGQRWCMYCSLKVPLSKGHYWGTRHDITRPRSASNSASDVDGLSWYFIRLNVFLKVYCV